MKSYRVILDVIETHKFDVLANTQDGAIVAAEELLADGDYGRVSDREIISADAYPLEEIETES